MNGAKELQSWAPLWIVLGAYLAIAATVTVIGARSGRSGSRLAWPAVGLEKVTGIAGWAPAMTGTAAIGLLTAGIGFYNDVAWHIGLGRDKELFTAPHTMIVVGLGIITVAAGLGIFLATLTSADVPLRWGGLRIPWSSIPLGLLGMCALAGFPLDDIWHGQYGIDVTMWSPTHMLMICGASLSLVAAWLALAEAGVATTGGRWARVSHLLAGFLVLLGLSSVQGEFAFGVPQFQQLYHPVLVTLAAAFAFVACRVVMGPGRALAVAGMSLLLGVVGMGEADFVPQRAGGIYVVSAVVVEIVALVLGTERRLRFALVSGLGVATLGLAGEWVWNQGAYQPWTAALLPDALLLCVLVGLGAAVLGAAWGGAISRDAVRIPAAVVAGGAIAVLLALAVPLPRTSSPVTASVDVTPVGDGQARVAVVVEPADAADDARWFQLSAWQGDGLVLADMREESPGRWVGESPVPVTGRWKTLVRLHRGSDMMAVPIWLPADPEIGADEIPAVDRTAPFVNEQRYLLRELKDGPATYERIVYAILALVAALWATSFTLAAKHIRDRRPPSAREEQVPLEIG